MVLLINLCSEALLDPLMRLPIALAFDHLIGPLWKSVQDNSKNSVHSSDIVEKTNGIAISDELLFTWNKFIRSEGVVATGSFLAAFLCWMTLKFLPRTQLMLFGQLVAIFASASVIHYLIALSAEATWSMAVIILVATNILHAELISDLRHLRFFELMSCPSLADVVGSRSSFIANTAWLTVWPNLPLIAVLYNASNMLRSTDRLPIFGTLFHVAEMTFVVPVLFFLFEAVRWRIFVCRKTLARQRAGSGIKMSVIGSYYACVETFIWESVGEDKINKAYAMVWMSKVAFAVVNSFLSHSPADTFADIPRLIVNITLSSYVSMFGFCWIIAHLYHEFFSRWLFAMDIVLNHQQISSHEMQKFDFSGHLFVFFHQASMITVAGDRAGESLTRLLLFLLLFRLSVIPDNVRMYSHKLALESSGHLKFFIKGAVEGALAPFLLGVVLFGRVWQAPFSGLSFFDQVWAQNLTLPFAPEFEMWIHSESLLAVGDLLVAFTVAVFCIVAYPSSQVIPAGDSAHFWHRYLSRVDFASKVWLQVVRELAGIIVHLIIISFLLEQLWQTITTADTDVMGWGHLMNFAVYFGRYADGNVRFSYTTQHGISSDIVCSYRCVIKELPPPEEEAFAEWKDVCGICQSSEENRLTLCVFPCNHFFHRDCIEGWLKIRMSCPMCMRTVWFENGLVKMDNLSGSSPNPVTSQQSIPDDDGDEEDFDEDF